mmetsp:Transcript_25265/g.31637  ORF Transcript_25265/g.31637 Transcript_25265/m.31637 type:complete len:98 (-) Transcript_25265:1386-1679(-)|eukprot:CAMPEP_0170472976 /NCGR_PEP_ID=MMETSP0123-20130129/14934_1 /TAXON_ID=182087 /ORGANISM="Favella ehrenbergii, Strain Fehren 1" /LENGTH=97 /DNA_ID=CAMNT_0010741639 /DNA_START=1655 /DNA_END=1948 /DNA_ORIENTATION=+
MSVYANRSSACYQMMPKMFRATPDGAEGNEEQERQQVDGGERSQNQEREQNGSENGCKQRSDGHSSKKDRGHHGVYEQRTQVIELCDHFEFYSDNEG